MKRRTIQGLLAASVLAAGLGVSAPAQAQDLDDLLRAGERIFERLVDGDRWDDGGVLRNRDGRIVYYRDARGRFYFLVRQRDGDLVRRYVDRDRIGWRDDRPRRRFFVDARGRFYYVFDRDGNRWRRYVELW